jgi:3-oxoacyl-[acyl-carrier protein] reductase
MGDSSMKSGILAGKTAIVTGAGNGIARSTARVFAEEGAAVVVVDIDARAAERTVAEIVAAQGLALAQVCDVSSRTQVDAAVAKTVSVFGAVDILVNAAFANPSFGKSFVEQTEADLQVNLGSSFMGTWNFMQACFPQLNQRKGAVIGLMNTVALEWGPLGINVNAISPGTHEGYVASNPMRRLGNPDKDTARVALFLAARDAMRLKIHKRNRLAGMTEIVHCHQCSANSHTRQ